MLSLVSPVKADPCSDCRTQKRVTCSSKCDSAPDRIQYDKCVKDCVNPACAPKCVPGSEGGETLESAEEVCRSCLMKKLAEGCPDRCDRASPRYESCRKTCAKQRCAKQCSLPDAGFHNAPPPPKYACEQCKASAELTCRASQSCRPGEPGSVACEFHCVAQTCKKVCDEESEQLEQ